MTALPAKILTIWVTDETSQEMPWLTGYHVEIQCKYDADEYLAWSDRLIETPSVVIDGVRFALYGVACSGPCPLDMTIELHTMGDEKLRSWDALASKWSQEYGYRYQGWRPGKNAN